MTLPDIDPVLVSFDVRGVAPKPKGSLVHVAGRHYRESAGEALAEWMSAVETAARRERMKLGRPLLGPLVLECMIRLPMPQSRPARLRRLPPGEGVPCSVMPDWDKLARAIGDALTRSQLIGDDKQIYSGKVTKYEVTGWIGASIDLWEMPPP